jgi:hypothetical protein
MKLRWPSIIFYCVYFLLFLFTCTRPFFWDTIQLGSVHASWFYENHFSNFILPQWMDSGHPPFLGILLALAWTVFGKSLFVSHAIMLPFLFMIIYQTGRLTEKLFPPSYLFAANALLLFEATLLAQSTLISPDVILIAFFIYSLNATFSMKRWHLALALLVLSMLSMRGMMCCALIFVLNVYQFLNGYEQKKNAGAILNALAPFVPGAVAALCFLAYHFEQTGWIGYHPASPWAEAFERPGWRGFFFNLFVLGWRLGDFGKIFVWIVLAFCFIWIFRKKAGTIQSHPGNWLLFLAIASIAILGVPLMFFKNLLAHRYLLPAYFSVNLLTLHLLFRLFRRARAKMVIFFLVVGELTGHFWVYPKGIAMGWDSTLAYLPYFSMRQECIDWLNAHQVVDSVVGTGFPNESCYKYTNLRGEGPCFSNYNLQTNEYVFYSNVFNDFSKKEIENLYNNWQPELSLHRGAVDMVIFRKK